VHEKISRDLRTASRSIERVKEACDRLGIRKLRAADLAEHKD